MWAMFSELENCTKQKFHAWRPRTANALDRCNGQTFAQDGNPSFVRRETDKHLTRLAKTCDNILRNYEDYMARQNGRGSSRPWDSTRSALNSFPVLPFHRLQVSCARSVGFCVVVLLLAGFSFAQTSDVDDIHVKPRVEAPKLDQQNILEGEKPPARSPLVKTKVNLVLVPVTVTDPMNRLVTGLDKENFQVFEGKEQQEVRNFSSEDAPVSLGVIFDMSGSMSSKIERAREAVIEFFKTANPQDEFFIVAFADKPEEVSDFTQSVDDLQGKLIFTVPKGRTALLDAIYLGISKMRQAKYPKKALLIISDGGDNHSRYTEGEIKSLVKEADVMIYSIGI